MRPAAHDQGALVFQRVSNMEIGRTWLPCDNGCLSTKNGHNNDNGRCVARYRVSICGWPAGAVCEPCKRRWRKAWDEALKDAGEGEEAALAA